MNHTAKFTSIDDFRSYALAGKAVFTIISLQTGNRRTFRVRKTKTDRMDRGEGWFVDLLVGPDNTDNYKYIGFVWKDQYGYNFKPHREPGNATLLWWIVNKILNVQEIDPRIEIWHSGHCSRCGRLLTTPESIERGLGPVCAERSV